jgi:hypothetical protein
VPAGVIVVGMSVDRNHPLIKPGECIRVNGTQGYVVAVHEDDFEFGRVTNAYEHFSNISAPPDLDVRRIRFEDVDDVTT